VEARRKFDGGRLGLAAAAYLSDRKLGIARSLVHLRYVKRRPAQDLLNLDRTDAGLCLLVRDDASGYAGVLITVIMLGILWPDHTV
jgi:hypothetical protein